MVYHYSKSNSRTESHSLIAIANASSLLVNQSKPNWIQSKHEIQKFDVGIVGFVVRVRLCFSADNETAIVS